jgi:hypothetical protein
MLAEKTALLNSTDEDDIPRLTSDQPTSPMDERRDPISIVTPGDANIADPLSAIPTGSGREGMSEKARGKLRAVDPNQEGDTMGNAEGMVDVEDEELMRVAAGGVGPGGYVPTQEWVSSWQRG